MLGFEIALWKLDHKFYRLAETREIAYLFRFEVVPHPGTPVFLGPKDTGNNLKGCSYASRNNEGFFVDVV